MTSPVTPPPFDARQLRQTLGRFATGVTIVTCVDAAGQRIGLTANSFNALSLDPPLVLWSLRQASPSVAAFRAAGHFAINVLAESQVELSRRFASPVADKFAAGDWARGLDGVPVLYYGTGIFLDAEIIPGGEIAVAWYDHVAGNLMYIRTNTGNFSPDVAVVLDGETSGPEGPVDTGDVGWYPDLYIAADGTQYISYADHTRGTLRVIDVGARVSTPVDDGVRCYEPDPESGGCLDPLVLRVGYDSAIAPTADGLAMVYQDATWHEVLESPLTPFGWDLPGTVATGGDPYTGAYGFYLGHVDSTQGRYVFSYRINQRANPTTRDVAVIER